MSTYSDQLRDPRWQRKRLEIMQRDGFRCTICTDATSTLNVHHCYYEGGASPWEYPDPSLVTLCESCHEKETGFLKTMKNSLSIELGRLGAMSIHYYELATAFSRLDPTRLTQAIWFIGFFLSDQQFQDRFFAELPGAAAEPQAAEDRSCPPTA